MYVDIPLIFQPVFVQVQKAKGHEAGQHQDKEKRGQETQSPKPFSQRDKGAESPYMEDIFKVEFCTCVAACVSPAPPLNQCWGCVLPRFFPSPGGISINIDRVLGCFCVLTVDRILGLGVIMRVMFLLSTPTCLLTLPYPSAPIFTHP